MVIILQIITRQIIPNNGEFPLIDLIKPNPHDYFLSDLFMFITSTQMAVYVVQRIIRGSYCCFVNSINCQITTLEREKPIITVVPLYIVNKRSFYRNKRYCIWLIKKSKRRANKEPLSYLKCFRRSKTLLVR